jgi:uncharacterized cupredoxin-like copper-binding protein
MAAARSNQSATVTVSLKEMSISLSRTHVPAGKVSFVVRNMGSIEHEMVVVRKPRSGKLRIVHFKAAEDGSVGEVEDVPAGKARKLTLALQRGRYLLICNMPGHYQLGMRAEIAVT